MLPRLRARRRRRLRTALVAACVAVALGVAYAVGGTSPRPDPPAYGDVLSWPARGPLAHDQAFVDELARRAANGRVIYAGDVAGERVGLVVSRYPGLPQVGLTAFVGRAGTRADRLAETDPGLVSPTARVVAWADPEPSGVHVLVVLAESRAHTAAVSSAAVARLGHIDRSFVTHHMHDGVVAVPARAPSVRMMRVSVAGAPGSPYDGPVLGIERTPYPPGSRAPRPMRSYGATAGVDEAWRDAAAELAGTYRVPFARLLVLWRWARVLGTETVLLAAAYRLPTGAIVLQVRWRSRRFDNNIAVSRFVRGRLLLDPTEPVAWRMGGQIAVFWPGARHRAVVLNGSVRSSPAQLVTHTDADGFAAVTVPPRMRDPWVHVPLGRSNVNGYILSTSSPFDQDPLDIGDATPVP
ncbi:MAG: hypothetical protein J2P24_10050 [Streptosporangiales bacterium]|nr:hypothetical protein [Streptosporangiales bacterium]MBO0892503.1 hypothetical protein [Acidothermales bacterium]